MAHPLLPLLILFVVILGGAVIGYMILTVANDVSDKTRQKLEKRNISFSKEGLKVGVKDKGEEHNEGVVQSYMVAAWNLSTWPAYKSMFWNKQKPKEEPRRQAYSRSTSSLSTVLSQPSSKPATSRSTTATSAQSAPASKPASPRQLSNTSNGPVAGLDSRQPYPRSHSAMSQ